MQTINIGRLAELAKVNIDTIRYYEKQGLLPPASRTSSGYRQYEKADLERLRHDPLVESLARGAPTTRILHSVYFDTPDLRLARAGVALRVRRSGDRFIQILT